MGNRTYLYTKLSKPTPKNCLETNNSLAFFWLTLLDKKAIKNIEPNWIFVSNLNDEEYDKLYKQDKSNPKLKTEISLPYQRFKNNKQIGEVFIKTHYPSLIKLYNDFINLLEKKLKSKDDALIFDIFQITNFTSVLEFINELNIAIELIHQNQLEKASNYLDIKHPVATGSGFSYELEQTSKAYQSFQKSALLKRQKSIEHSNNRKTTNKNFDLKVKAISTFVIVLVFLFLIINSNYNPFMIKISIVALIVFIIWNYKN